MTASGPISILFAHYGDDWFRGSEQVLCDLLTNLDRDRVNPILWCNGAAMEEVARSRGITTYRTPFEFYFDYRSPRFNLARYRSLVRKGAALVHQHDIQVLHANSAAPNQWLVPVARATKRPLLTHLHIDYRRRSRFVCLLHQSTLVVGVSRQVTEDLLRDGMAAERTHTIYNGIDFIRLKGTTGKDQRQELGIARDAVVITTAGSLIERKGQDVLIRAIALLLPGRDLHLLVAGEGPERGNYEIIAEDLGVRDKVHFVGHIDDVSALYRATDIVAFASRADAFGLVLAEAGYFSLPVVATTVGGIPEVVADGVTGLLVPPNDPAALARALSQFLDDPVRRRTFGAAAKARVERMFSVEQMVTNFQETYARLARLQGDRLGWLGDDLSFGPYLKLFHLAKSRSCARASLATIKSSISSDADR